MPKSLYAALILLSLIWGGSFFFIKILLDDFGPWTIAFFRAAVGLATITVIMLLLRKPIGFRRIPWLQVGIMALFNTSIPWALIAFSETRVTSGLASVLNATTPLWTIVVGTLFFRTATGRLQWIGMLISLVGLMILLGVNPVSIISIDGLGFGCMMAATLCYAIGSQLSKRLKGLSMYQVTFGTLFCAAIVSGITAFLTEPVSFTALAPSGSAAGALIGLGLFGSGVAYILFYYMIQKGSPEFATMVTYLVPVSAIIWGYTLLNEAVHWNLLAGLVVVLAGVFLATRSRSGSRSHKLTDTGQAAE